MRKKVKGLVGICLVAALSVGSVVRYAHANPVPLVVEGHDGIVYYANGGCSIGETSGSAYTASVGNSKCHCSVSATFRWYDQNGNLLYSNGNGAGGMHGASISMHYTNEATRAGGVVAHHTANATVGGYASADSAGAWSK